MAKRKRNQQGAKGQHDAASPSKKVKVASDAPQEKHASGKPPVVSQDPKRQSESEPSKPADSKPAGTPRLGKTARKRERQRKMMREAKKSTTSTDKAGDAGQPTQSEPNSAPQQQKTASVPDPSQPPSTQHDNKSAKGKDRGSKDSVNREPSKSKNGSLSSTALTSKKKRDDLNDKKVKDAQSGSSSAKKPEGAHGRSDQKLSKKKLRRQKEYQAKQAALLTGDSTKELASKSSKQVKSSPSTNQAPKKENSSLDAALLHETTKTPLLTRPIKQWVEQDDLGLPELTGTKEASNDILDPLTKALQGAPEATPSRLPNTPAKPSSQPKNSSAASKPEIPDSFATVGVSSEPATTSTPLTRPGINTIASFSLSSRRHPPTVLAKQRTISGLSGMRMDTGMIGNSPKPASAVKATSVPSHTGSGDVKAAFSRFNKFAHGGNSSDSDDDSDDSDSSSEAEAEETKRPGSAQTATRNAEKSYAAPSAVASETKAAASVSHTGASADSSESEDEAMVDSAVHRVDETNDTHVETDINAAAPNAGEGSLAQPLNNAPRMLGEKDLPLFSDFNAKHNITSADASLQRSASFLARELGGGPSGFGQTDDADAPVIDYVASQDADDLYRSIEDISREVFGSTREIPDCKPLSNYLDNASEPFVTGFISDHGLGRKSAELETPEKTTALNNILRGTSPVVYIIDEMNIGGSTGLDDADEGIDEQGGEDEVEQNIDSRPFPAAQEANTTRYSSPLTSISNLTRSSKSPGDRPPSTPADANNDELDAGNQGPERLSEDDRSPQPVVEVKKRRVTGTTSKHFSPKKPLSRTSSAVLKPEPMTTGEDLEQPANPDDLAGTSKSQKRGKKKGTGKTSVFFTPTSSPSKPTDPKKATPRPPKGTSTCPVPSTNSAHFGLIQEKLWTEPFWLIIAVTFLNKTAGRAAAPIFWSLKELYPTPEALSQAKEKDLVDMIGTLGLQNQRAKRLILISKTWLDNPPAKNQRYRTLHYPAKNDGKEIKKDQIVDEDADACEGALEIGHIPGCGPYAWDSWRIFCRDVQRGLAKDYNGRGAVQKVGFVPEWQKVVPLDKELRACLRWMWLREGYVWNHEDGSKRDATLEEMEAALKGEMEIADEQERKFAMEAANGAGDEVGSVVKNEGNDDKEASVNEAESSVKAAKKAGSRKMSIARRELDVESGDEVAVSTVRRSRRNKGA